MQVNNFVSTDKFVAGIIFFRGFSWRILLCLIKFVVSGANKLLKILYGRRFFSVDACYAWFLSLDIEKHGEWFSCFHSLYRVLLIRDLSTFPPDYLMLNGTFIILHWQYHLVAREAGAPQVKLVLRPWNHQSRHPPEAMILRYYCTTP